MPVPSVKSLSDEVFSSPVVTHCIFSWANPGLKFKYVTNFVGSFVRFTTSYSTAFKENGVEATWF